MSRGIKRRMTLAALSGLTLVSLVIGCSRAPETGNPAASQAAPSPAARGMVSLSPQQALKMMGERKDLVVVDVRGQSEFTTGVIEGSVAVPFWAVMRGEHRLPRDKALVLVCAVGGRSYAAAQVLAGSGYSEVYNLSGGIAAWKRAGLPLK